jgi:hypothetical protein
MLLKQTDQPNAALWRVKEEAQGKSEMIGAVAAEQICRKGSD